MEKHYQPSYRMDDLEIEHARKIPGDFFSMTQYKGRFRRYDGSMSDLMQREVFVTPYDAAGILLYDPKQQTIALTEQCRFALANDQESPWVLEIVMGMMDNPEESPFEAALREAKEEAGASVMRVEPVASYYPSPGVSTEFVNIFCGEVDMSAVGGIHGLAAEQEDIKVVIMNLAQAEQAMRTGVIKTATTIITLQWLLLHKDTLWQ